MAEQVVVRKAALGALLDDMENLVDDMEVLLDSSTRRVLDRRLRDVKRRRVRWLTVDDYRALMRKKGVHARL